jgi:polyisoprenoid-binding protein YceI
MKIKRFAAVFVLALVTTPLFAADTFVIDKVHSEATFQVKHLMSKVTGKFDDFAGSIDIEPNSPAASSVVFTIKTASINTGVGDRDKDLRSANFFDAEKNPEITFKSTGIKATDQKDVYNVTGDFTMHGVTRRVLIPVEFLGYAKDPWGNTRAGFSISTKVNRKDYGMNWNKALDNGGYLLSDDVAININIEAVKAKPKTEATAPGEKKGK